MARRALPTVELHYELRGRGVPVLLVHGWCDSGAGWERVAAALEGEARLLVPDLRGFGRSGRPADSTYSLEAATNDLVALCRAEGLERPVVVGHSLGGYLGATLVRRFPGFARGLVVVDQVLDSGALAAALRPMEADVRDPAKHVGFRSKFAGLLLGAGAPEATVRRIESAYRDAPVDVALAYWAPIFERTGAEHAADLAALLGALATLPSLHLLSQPNPDYARALQAAAPAARVEVLAGGHWVHEEHEPSFLALLRSFLGALPVG